jgi:hypothetical protein
LQRLQSGEKDKERERERERGGGFCAFFSLKQKIVITAKSNKRFGYTIKKIFGNYRLLCGTKNSSIVAIQIVS